MDTFSARPERIIGNVALASLVAGVPLGILLSVAAAVFHQHPAGIELIKNIALGAIAGPAFVFVCGLVIVAPLLALLRRFGSGGPFFVYAVSIAIGIPFLSNSVPGGVAVISMALAASYVFCRFAYANADRGPI